MSIKINRKSMDAISKALQAVVAQRVQAASAAYVEAMAEGVAYGARTRAPELSGWLKSSAYATSARPVGGGHVAEAGFVASYAKDVHERGSTQSGEPKFLQNEVDQSLEDHKKAAALAAQEAFRR